MYKCKSIVSGAYSVNKTKQFSYNTVTFCFWAVIW